MTPSKSSMEKARQAIHAYNNQNFKWNEGEDKPQMLAHFVAIAIDQEREECAKVAENVQVPQVTAGYWIAKAIRERKEA